MIIWLGIGEASKITLLTLAMRLIEAALVPWKGKS